MCKVQLLTLKPYRHRKITVKQIWWHLVANLFAINLSVVILFLIHIPDFMWKILINGRRFLEKNEKEILLSTWLFVLYRNIFKSLTISKWTKFHNMWLWLTPSSINHCLYSLTAFTTIAYINWQLILPLSRLTDNKFTHYLYWLSLINP